jgi:two-component system, chemotaxis family, chemotaxis protein CheY
MMYSVDCSRLRFLIVDDNIHMRRIIRALLHGFGVREAHEAEDGAAGLEAFTSYSPDIVITDWAMPIFDGVELTRMIRQADAIANPFVPIIMVSGYAERRKVLEARDAGVNFSQNSLSKDCKCCANTAPLYSHKNIFWSGSTSQYQSKLQ